MKKSIFSIIAIMILVMALTAFRGWFIPNVLDSLAFAPRLISYYALWWVVLIPIFLFMRGNKETCGDLGFTKAKMPPQILTGILLGLVTSFALSGIVTLAGQRELLYGFTEGDIPAPGVLAYRIFEVMILTALVEEIIFRGYLFKKIMDVKNSKLLAIIVTALLFGFMHIVNGPNIIFIISPTIFGFIYGACRANLKNCSLLSLIIAHGLHDALNGSVIFGLLDLL